MIGDDAEGDVDGICSPLGAPALPGSVLVYFFRSASPLVEDRPEDVGLVIRYFGIGEVGEIFVPG